MSATTMDDINNSVLMLLVLNNDDITGCYGTYLFLFLAQSATFDARYVHTPTLREERRGSHSVLIPTGTVLS